GTHPALPSRVLRRSPISLNNGRLALRPSARRRIGCRLEESIMSEFVQPPPHVAKNLIFDIPVSGTTDELLVRSPFEVWNRLRDMPPVFWTRKAPGGGHGCWVAGGADAIREIMQDPEHFSNDRAK